MERRCTRIPRGAGSPYHQEKCMRSRARSIKCVLAFVGLLWFASAAIGAARPNVVIILADDEGWGDLSVNGNTNVSTPNIDSLAKTGALLEHFFVCPVCSPTRAEFLTGRYHSREGV